MTVTVPDTIKPGGAFPVALSPDISRPDGSTIEEALVSTPTTFETTDATPRLYITDQAGRVVLELPDPRFPGLLEAVAAQATAIAQASTGAVFETTDPTAAVFFFDAGGRIVAQLPDPALANLAATVWTAATGLLFETTDISVAAIVVDAAKRVVALIPSPAAVAAATPTTVAEVVTARGNMPTLDARLSPNITADGAPIIERYGRDRLRRLHYMLMKRALPVPEAIQIIINLAGDSYTHGNSYWSQPFAEFMVASYGDAGGGWCGFGSLINATSRVPPWTLANQPSFTNGNVRKGLYPTTILGNAAPTYYTNAGPDLAMLTLSQDGDGVLQGFPATPAHNGCDFFFFGSGDGLVRYSWGTYKGAGAVADPASYNFAASTTIAVQGAVNTTQIADLKAGIPAGQGALLVEWVAGTAKLFGVNLKSAASGVRINKLAATGSAISHWANAPAVQFEVGIAALGAHAFIYMDGTNSQAANMLPATWGNHLKNLVARMRSATPGLDILAATPAENQRPNNPFSMALYGIELRRQAMAGRFACIDMQQAFGDPLNPTEYGPTGSVPLYDNDSVHPAPATGGRLLLAQFLDTVTPF